MDKKIPKEVTLECIEAVVDGNAQFKKWGSFDEIEILETEGFVPDLNDSKYKDLLKARLKDRYDFIKSREEVKGGYDKLPDEALNAIKKLIDELN